jgi:hypothetical protein
MPSEPTEDARFADGRGVSIRALYPMSSEEPAGFRQGAVAVAGRMKGAA